MVRMTPFANLQSELRACTLCADAGYAITGPPVFSGNADSRVMLIGQAPGVTEVENQRPFNFTSGTRLFQWLGEAGWDEADFREKHYMASVTRCFPGKHANGRRDRVPTREEQRLCAPWRERELALLDLKVIIPVGKLAIGLYFDAGQPLTAIIGSTKTVDDIVIVPLPHPSGASTWHMQPQNRALIDAAIEHLRRLKKRHDL
jgi:uracil-DNA glycosylase